MLKFGDAELDKPKRPNWHEFVPGFLSKSEAQELFDWLMAVDGWHIEEGYCPTPNRPMKDQHDTIQWGPRQAYFKCVPGEYRVKSSGDIPEYLMPLHRRIEQRYQATFNSIQCNRHFNEHSSVHAHFDRMHGDIVMLSLGASRRFILRYAHNDKAKTLNRWKAGDMYASAILPDGSLLTIYGAHQHDLQHEMPEFEKPCGIRISMIWRYITAADVEGPLEAKPSAVLGKGYAEFKEAQAKWKGGQSA